MIRRPSPAWVDLARGDAFSAGAPTLDDEAPAVDVPHRGENDNAGAMPSFGLSAGGRSAALLPGTPARGRRLGVTIALILSAAIHAAAFAWLAGNLPVEGMEAQSEGVSVEIVFDAPAASASPAIAGNDGAADTGASAVVEQALAEVVEPELAEVEQALAPEPAEPRDAAAAVEPEVVAPIAAEASETVTADAAEPVDGVELAETVEPVAVAGSESIAGTRAREPVAADIAAPTVAETVKAEPAAAPVAAEPIEPAIEPVVPAFAPPAPDVAAMALLAAPPSVEALAILDPVPDNAAEDALPETVERVPEPRPEPPVAEARTAMRKAPRPATTQARAVELPRKSASAETEPNARKAPAKDDAVARPDKKPAGPSRKPAADAARNPAPATSAGSRARAAAAPGAEAKYGRKLLSHVERHKRYPAAARSAGITGSTRLAITIDRAGGLSGARVSAGSGHRILDQEALAVARRAAPYPRPPEGVGGRTFSFAVTLRFTR